MPSISEPIQSYNPKPYTGGYIKLWRKFLEWGHFKNSNTVHVFITLLLLSEYQETPGQAIVSYGDLSRLTGIA